MSHHAKHSTDYGYCTEWGYTTCICTAQIKKIKNKTFVNEYEYKFDDWKMNFNSMILTAF